MQSLGLTNSARTPMGVIDAENDTAYVITIAGKTISRVERVKLLRSIVITDIHIYRPTCTISSSSTAHDTTYINM